MKQNKGSQLKYKKRAHSKIMSAILNAEKTKIILKQHVRKTKTYIKRLQCLVVRDGNNLKHTLHQSLTNNHESL